MASGDENLVFVESTMKKDYVEILRRNLETSIRKLNLSEEYTFQSDNDPKHMVWQKNSFFTR